jgi:hypothetical protein
MKQVDIQLLCLSTCLAKMKALLNKIFVILERVKWLGRTSLKFKLVPPLYRVYTAIYKGACNACNHVNAQSSICTPIIMIFWAPVKGAWVGSMLLS